MRRALLAVCLSALLWASSAVAQTFDNLCALGTVSGSVMLDGLDCAGQGGLSSSLYRTFTMTLAGDVTLNAQNLLSGVYTIELAQDVVGSHAVTFGAAFLDAPGATGIVTDPSGKTRLLGSWDGSRLVIISVQREGGILGCAQMPALSGSITSTAGTCVTSLSETIDAVQTDQSNTYTTGDQDFGAAASLKVPVAAGATAAVNGRIAYDSTANMLHAAQTGADAFVAQFTTSPTNDHCVKWVVSGGTIKLGTAGAACGSGGGGDPNVTTLTDATPVAINVDNTDLGVLNTLSQATTFSNPTGTPTDTQSLIIRITSASAQNLTWGSAFSAGAGVTLPTATTGAGVIDYFGFRWNANAAKWDIIAATSSVLKVEKKWIEGGRCNGTNATANWSSPVSPGAAIIACVTGTNTIKGLMDYVDTATNSLQYTMPLPDDWTGAVDAKIFWLSTATTGNVKWQFAVVCTADAETDDPAFGTADTVTDATKGTANQMNVASISPVTMTGCAAGEMLHIKLLRDPADAADTLGATARMFGVELTLRRTN